MNTKGWNAYGSFERCQLTFRTLEFLRKALSYAEEFLHLSNEIFHPNTVDAVIKVLPEVVFHKIRCSEKYQHNFHSSSESMGKKCIVKLKEIMELEQEVAIKDVNRYQALKENQVAFSSASATQSPPSPSTRKNGKPGPKPSRDGHDCKK